MNFCSTFKFSKSNSIIKAVCIVFAVSMLFSMLLGFPVFLPDSKRYLASAALLQTSFNAPTIFPFLLRPVYLLIGPWAFVVANCAMIATLSVLVSDVLYCGTFLISIILSLVSSTVLFCACFVMMDIQVSFTMLALLLLYTKCRSILSGVILGCCLVSHNSAILIVTISSFILYILTGNHRFILRYILILFVSLSALSLYNYKFENRLSPFPRHSTQFIVARMIVDIPEAMDTYVNAHPSSSFSSFWSAFREKYSADLERHDDSKLEYPILWGRDGFPIMGKDEVANESFRFILFTLSNFTGKYVQSLLTNFIHFFSQNLNPSQIGNAFVVWNGYDFSQYQSIYFPGYKEMAARGAQSLERLHLFFFPALSVLLFWMSLVFNFIIIILFLMNKNDNTNIFVFSLLNIIFVLANGFVVSNFGVNTSDGRFFVKPFWPCIFSMFLWIEYALRRRRSVTS